MKDMLKLQQVSSMESEWKSRCVQRFRPRPWKSLLKVFAKGLEFWERQIRLAGIGCGSRGSLNMQGQNLKLTHRSSRALGCRAQGAGRKDLFGVFKRALKNWVFLERENGHTLDSGDLLEQFKWMVGEAIKTLKEQEKAGTLTPAARSRLLEYEARIARIAGKWSYRKWYMAELVRACGCRSLKPQRQTKLSYAEEGVRCRLTWQQWDRKMWEICFGGAEVLKGLVVDSDHFQSRLEDCVLGFSDQVPWWGLVGSKKQVYCQWEVCKKQLAAKGETMQQLRGHDNEAATKFRITVELRQLILNYFSRTEDPIGVLGPSLVVVGGATHCRLSNISADGRWLESETFVVNGKEVRRIKGRSVGNVMKPWRDLRARCPELFEGLSLMQQPAAVVDSIIMAWVLEEQAKLYPCSLWQRDLSGGGGFSTASRQRMQLIGQVAAWIAGKMTSVLQLTDTDFARRLKAFAMHEKDLLKQEMKAAAAKAGVGACTFRCGAYEILRIIKRSLQRLEEVTVKENLVLAAARRNGMLAWRPDLTEGKLVCPDEQPWCRGLPPTCRSHRLKSGWTTGRMNWLDAEGRPLEPDWTQCEVAKGLEDHCDFAALPAPSEVTLQGGEWVGPRSTVGGTAYEEVQFDLGDFDEFKGEEGLGEGFRHAAFLQASPRDRLLDMETSALIAPQGEVREASKAAGKELKARLQSAFLKKWRAKTRKQIADDGVSRLELLATLAPKCGRSLAADPAKLAVKKWMKTISKVEFSLCFFPLGG